MTVHHVDKLLDCDYMLYGRDGPSSEGVIGILHLIRSLNVTHGRYVLICRTTVTDAEAKCDGWSEMR